MKMGNYHPTVLMYMKAGFLAAGAGCVMVALRRVRGRVHVLDASLIVVALTVSQYHNLLWAFQIWATLSGALVLAAIAVATDIGGSGPSPSRPHGNHRGPSTVLRRYRHGHGSGIDPLASRRRRHLQGQPQEYHPIGWVGAISDSLVHTGTAYMFSTVERLEIGLSTGFREWELLSSERLEPTATTGGGGATPR